MELYLVKQLNGSLLPAYDSDYEKVKKIKQGDTVKCEVKKPRNIKFHKKFFALMNLVYQNQERYEHIDDLREQLTIAAGYYTTTYTLDGVEQQKAKSISFAAMDELEFGELYNALLDVIVKYFHFDRIEIEQNLAEFY